MILVEKLFYPRSLRQFRVKFQGAAKIGRARPVVVIEEEEDQADLKVGLNILRFQLDNRQENSPGVIPVSQLALNHAQVEEGSGILRVDLDRSPE